MVKTLLTSFLALGLVLTPSAALAQTTNTDSNNTTTTTTSTDNSQDNDTINKEKVVVVCKVNNKIDKSANVIATQVPVTTGTGNQTVGDQPTTQTITQETTVDQLPSVVANFEQRGCDITVNYKTTVAGPNPTPVVVTNTNTVERIVERPTTNTVVRTVATPSLAPATGGN